MQTDVSVIIPIYNVEEYLRECLDSMLEQGDVSLEVILMDDESTDRSGDIAQEYADKYDWFRYHKLENGGPSRARNIGVKHAQGKYIIFCDSDDIVPANTYFRMFSLAEETGAEVVVCNAERFDSERKWASGLHRRVFQQYERTTHIKRNYHLLYDTTSPTKMIRRDFYESIGLNFPEGTIYEDIPFSLNAYLKCNKCAMMKEVGYRWRSRDGRTRSLTQNLDAMQNLKDRLGILKNLKPLYDNDSLGREFALAEQHKILEVDLMVFINQCGDMPDEDAFAIIDAVNQFIEEEIYEEAFDSLTILEKQKYLYVRERSLNKLRELISYKEYSKEKVSEIDNKLYIELPDELFVIKEREVTEELGKTQPKVNIDSIKRTGNTYQIIAHIFHNRVSVKEGEQEVRVFLSDNIEKFELPSKPYVNEELTAKFGSSQNQAADGPVIYNYDGAGFEFELNLEQLKKDCCKDGTYHIEIDYKNRFHEGTELLKLQGKALTETNNRTVIFDDDISAKMLVSNANELFFLINRNSVYLEDSSISGSIIEIRLDKRVDRLFAKQQHEGEKNHIALEKLDEDRFALDINNLELDTYYYLTTGRGEENTVLRGKRDAKLLADELIALQSSFRTNIPLLKRFDHISYIQDIEMCDSSALIHVCRRKRNGTIPNIVNASLIVENLECGEELILCGEDAFDISQDGVNVTFTLNLDDERLRDVLEQGRMDIYVRYVYDNGLIEKDVLHCEESIKYSVSSIYFKAKIYQSLYATVKMHVSQSCVDNPDYVRKVLYSKYKEETINEKRIVFESLWGRSYSCNPAALYEYIMDNHPEYECVWLLNDTNIEVPGNARKVKRGSKEHYYYLATSKYFVFNNNMPLSFKKREGQVIVQTMHGTPFKTFGLDVKDEANTIKERIRVVERSAMWDYLIAQGEFTTQMAWSWFRYKNSILKTGYPRTDAIFEPDLEKAAKIIAELGIDSNKKIILYAPTWRSMDGFEMMLDIERLRAELADEYVLLIRLHHFDAQFYNVPEDKDFVFDARVIDKIEDLFPITDILITDYSSTMFDFALTGKPMIFFAYDLDEYTKQDRGSYFDIMTEAPGIVTHTNRDLVRTIKDIAASKEKMSNRLQAFKNKYLTYEKNNSCSQVYAEVFEKESHLKEMSLTDMLKKRIEKIVPKRIVIPIRKAYIKHIVR